MLWCWALRGRPGWLCSNIEARQRQLPCALARADSGLLRVLDLRRCKDGRHAVKHLCTMIQPHGPKQAITGPEIYLSTRQVTTVTHIHTPLNCAPRHKHVSAKSTIQGHAEMACGSGVTLTGPAGRKEVPAPFLHGGYTQQHLRQQTHAAHSCSIAAAAPSAAAASPFSAASPFAVASGSACCSCSGACGCCSTQNQHTTACQQQYRRVPQNVHYPTDNNCCFNPLQLLVVGSCQ